MMENGIALRSPTHAHEKHSPIGIHKLDDEHKRMDYVLLTLSSGCRVHFTVCTAVNVSLPLHIPAHIRRNERFVYV